MSSGKIIIIVAIFVVFVGGLILAMVFMKKAENALGRRLNQVQPTAPLRLARECQTDSLAGEAPRPLLLHSSGQLLS
jgi:flagellar basal body-associated protein FliL